MRRWVFIICILFFCCNNNDDIACTTSIPPASVFLLKFENTEGQSLIGSMYEQDSFKLESITSTKYLKPIPFGVEDELAIWLEEIESGAIYYLELSSNDIDTLKIEHSLKQTPCFSYPELELFLYNDELIYQSGTLNDNLFVIIKE